MNELISIVIPAYNVENYISECIESVIKQTYTNIEIIIIDDGSTDLTGKICDDYAAIDKRIVVYHQCNSGLSAARNAGISYAHGEYIGLVDADDYIAPSMYERLIEQIHSTNADIAVCNYYIVQGMNLKKNHICINEQCVLEEDKKYDLIYLEAVYGIVAWNKLYDKKLFDKVRYVEGKRHEDNYIIHKLLSESTRICCSNEMLYFYRKRENSITSKIDKDRYNEDLEACYSRIEFFEKKEINEYRLKSIYDYLSRIITVYYKFSHVATAKEYRNQLYNAFKTVYRKLDNSEMTMGKKITYVLFLLNPYLASSMQRKIRNFRDRFHKK